MATLQENQDGLAQAVQFLEERLNECNARSAEVQGIIDRAEDLAQRGFGEGELARLYHLLAQVAASQGVPPEDGVAQFFEIMARHEGILSVDLEAQRAEMGATQAQATIDWRFSTGDARIKLQHL